MRFAKLRASLISKLSRFICLLFFVSPIFFVFSPTDTLVVVSAQSFDSIDGTSYPSQPNQTHENRSLENLIPYKYFLTLLLISLIMIGISVSILRYIRHQVKLTKIIHRSFPYKKIRRIHIILSDDYQVPFAYRTWKTRFIVIPSGLLTNYRHFLLVLKHEMQHHRQGDTSWAHLLFLLQSLFFWNPLIHIMNSRMAEIQELACDESLIGHQGVNAREYCDCLLSVAETALSSRNMLVGTASMALSSSAQKLKGRIDHMKRYEFRNGRCWGLVMAIISAGTITSVGMASSDWLLGKPITVMEAETLIQSTTTSQFPIEINERVVEQLNLYIGTVRGRHFIKESLDRKQKYETVFRKNLTQYQVPEDILAVALIESGFKNSAQNLYPMYSAGIWQFIPSTARRYGLTVSETTDERLDVERATDAAMRLLRNLNERFRDWRLAIIGYNAGGIKVQKGIDATGSRDPWILIEAGFEGDKDYLAKVMAGVIILKNPSLID